MQTHHRTFTLGILLAVAQPAVATAQARTGATGSTGRIAVTLASPPVSAPGRGFGDHQWPTTGGHRIVRPWGLSAGYPILVGTPYQSPAPPPVYVPYPVTYYYPVPARAPEPPPPPPKPYNPALSHMTVIGAGQDGGGGVMRVTRVGSDSLRVTWLGTSRPIREARLFLADADRRPLQGRVVDHDHPDALFALSGLNSQVAFTGLRVVFADGSTRTTLVPF